MTSKIYQTACWSLETEESDDCHPDNLQHIKRVSYDKKHSKQLNYSYTLNISEILLYNQ